MANLPQEPHVEAMNRTDLQGVVDIHMRAYQGFVNALWGRRYAEKFLEWYRTEDDCIALVSRSSSGEIQGYVVGMSLSRRPAWKVYQRSLVIGSAIRRPWVLCHPLFLKKIFARLRVTIERSGPDKTIGADASLNRVVGLVSIAVHPIHQGLGVGKALLREFEIVSAVMGFDAMRLFVSRDNEQALRAYESSGWIQGEQAPSANSGSVVFTKSC